VITPTHCQECGTHLGLQKEYELRVQLSTRRQQDFYEGSNYFDAAGASGPFCRECVYKFMQDFKNHYWKKNKE
jgi:hypothetical protein